MKVKDFLRLYKEDSLIQILSEGLNNKEKHLFHLKGIVGSLDAVVATSIYELIGLNHLFILHDKEEAAYFYNDLQNLAGESEALFFPTSYKRPYLFDETENANILMRAELLNRINQKDFSKGLIVTYPEALTERVINKRSLRENTFTAQIGEKVDIEFLSELFVTYGFERTDFTYEPGQFAVRGGIIDIYSFSNNQPYRIELFGNEIESIRKFDPLTQLSSDQVSQINIIPNIQTKLVHEELQSFLDFLPNNTVIWFKDYNQLMDILDDYYVKAQESFEKTVKQGGNVQIVMEPEVLFENSKSFEEKLKPYSLIEFGNRFYNKADQVLTFNSEPQPSFNKNFELITKALVQNQENNFINIIAAETEKQIESLHTIFEEIDPFVKFRSLHISLRSGYKDQNLKLTCYTDHQLLERFHRYKAREKTSKSKALTLKELRSLHPGDFVVHVDYGIGRFVGLEKLEINGKEQEALRLIYRDDDLLIMSIHSLHKISKYSGKEGTPPAISKLGSQDWDNKKKRVKKQVKDIAKDLIKLYAKRKASPGYAFTQDGFLQAELETSFIYEDTPDQAKATSDVKADMEVPHPMDRLVCGDVGFGKTEVAIRAAFKAVNDGKQVAVLVPTTILAMQHHRTFTERLSNMPVTVEYINRFKSSKDIKDVLKRLTEGKVDILIGTHRIVNKDVQFKDLGLMVIDEEQKFGVKVKERLKEMRVNVDSLTLTATPIPRTLHFSLMGARDLSIIATPPPNRQPVTTEIHVFNEEVIRDAISLEVKRGGQVFFVHNRIGDIEQIGDLILKLVPDVKIAVAHGQMDGEKLEKVMVKFIEGEYDVLVSTNIIESGLDIPNANTIIINRAHMFGLSDLHQMRGRVGRSNKKAYCYLVTPPTSVLSADARKRLSTLEEFSELGDGFKVAMRDLDIRGAGNLLGSEQSGFISDLGFDMYHKILDEAIQELKETEFQHLFEKELSETTKVLVNDCNIETDLEILIPESYVANISERLSLYSKIDNIKNEEDLEKFARSVIDRFGPMPDQVKDLSDTVRLRWKAETCGFEKLTLKNDAMKCYFLPSDNEAYYKSAIFTKIIKYVQQNPRKCKMREVKNRLILTIDEVGSIKEAKDILTDMVS